MCNEFCKAGVSKLLIKRPEVGGCPMDTYIMLRKYTLMCFRVKGFKLVGKSFLCVHALCTVFIFAIFCQFEII